MGPSRRTSLNGMCWKPPILYRYSSSSSFASSFVFKVFILFIFWLGLFGCGCGVPLSPLLERVELRNVTAGHHLLISPSLLRLLRLLQSVSPPFVVHFRATHTRWLSYPTPLLSWSSVFLSTHGRSSPSVWNPSFYLLFIFFFSSRFVSWCGILANITAGNPTKIPPPPFSSRVYLCKGEGSGERRGISSLLVLFLLLSDTHERREE